MWKAAIKKAISRLAMSYPLPTRHETSFGESRLLRAKTALAMTGWFWVSGCELNMV
jgi:hypothetical protein